MRNIQSKPSALEYKAIKGILRLRVVLSNGEVVFRDVCFRLYIISTHLRCLYVLRGTQQLQRLKNINLTLTSCGRLGEPPAIQLNPTSLSLFRFVGYGGHSIARRRTHMRVAYIHHPHQHRYPHPQPRSRGSLDVPGHPSGSTQASIFSCLVLLHGSANPTSATSHMLRSLLDKCHSAHMPSLCGSNFTSPA